MRGGCAACGGERVLAHGSSAEEPKARRRLDLFRAFVVLRGKLVTAHRVASAHDDRAAQVAVPHARLPAGAARPQRLILLPPALVRAFRSQVRRGSPQHAGEECRQCEGDAHGLSWGPPGVRWRRAPRGVAEIRRQLVGEGAYAHVWKPAWVAHARRGGAAAMDDECGGCGNPRRAVDHVARVERRETGGPQALPPCEGAHLNERLGIGHDDERKRRANAIAQLTKLASQVLADPNVCRVEKHQDYGPVSRDPLELHTGGCRQLAAETQGCRIERRRGRHGRHPTRHSVRARAMGGEDGAAPSGRQYEREERSIAEASSRGHHRAPLTGTSVARTSSWASASGDV